MHEAKTLDRSGDTPRKMPGRIDSSVRERVPKLMDNREMDLPCKVLEESGVQTYLRMDGAGGKSAANGGNVSPCIEDQITTAVGHHFILNGPTLQLHSHSPAAQKIAQPPHSPKPQHFKSLDNIRNVTQQSFAPSQKTILLPHLLPPSNGVYQSHVKTEKIPQVRNPLAHYSHINDRKAINSPARVNFDYANSHGSIVFNSYIPLRQEIPINAPSKMAPCISERQFQHGQSVTFWREKYEELNGRWQAMKLREVREKEVGVGRLAILQQKYKNLENSYEEMAEEYNSKLEENQQYYLRIQELQTAINQLQLISNTKKQQQDDTLIKQKDEQIKELAQKIRQLQKADVRAAYEEKCMLIGLLRKENQQYQTHLHNFQQRYQQEMQEMHQHMDLLQGQLQNREAQHPDRLEPSMLRSQHSQIQFDRSFDNNRIAELEAHINKLNAELASREDVFERELRQANKSLVDLAQRLKVAAAQKQQAVGSMQQKVGNMESDLNKKQSALRNLRDEVAAFRACPSVYSSAVNLIDHHNGNDKDDPLKRQLEALRRSLFERQREKMILRQKHEQLQQQLHQTAQALDRKKLQNQEIRRQLAQLDNLQHQNEKMGEVIAKRNAQIAEMKEMMLQKKQEAGDFQNLTQENDRLRNFMLKKNEQLSQLAQRLYNQEKKARDLQATYGPQLKQYQQDNHHLHDMLARREYQYNKMSQHLQQLQGNHAELQLQLQRYRHINDQYQFLLKANASKIEAYEEELATLRQDHQQESTALRERMEEYEFIISEKEQFEVKALKQIKELSQELEMRQEELQDMAIEQTQLRRYHQKSTKQLEDYENKHGELEIRCKELENQFNKCQQKLVKTEKELNIGKRQLKKHQKCTKVIDEMKEKMALYEMKLISLNMNRVYPSMATSAPSPVFEKKVIYQLKEENSILQQQVDHLIKKKKKNQDESGNKQEEQIKNRLNNFNHKLSQIIQNTPQTKRTLSVDHTPNRRHEDTPNRQMERLKQLAMDMQHHSTSNIPNARTSITPIYSLQNIQLIYKQELQFYRTKNAELQQRVQSMIKVNKDLKETMERAITNKNSTVKEYYEREIHRLEQEVDSLKMQRGRSMQHAKTLEARVVQFQQQHNNYLICSNLPSPFKTETSYNLSLKTRPASPNK